VGLAVGRAVGRAVVPTVGLAVGAGVGPGVGRAVGLADGAGMAVVGPYEAMGCVNFFFGSSIDTSEPFVRSYGEYVGTFICISTKLSLDSSIDTSEPFMGMYVGRCCGLYDGV